MSGSFRRAKLAGNCSLDGGVSKRSPEEAERIPGLHVYMVNCLSRVEVRARLWGFRGDNGDVPGMRFAPSRLRLLRLLTISSGILELRVVGSVLFAVAPVFALKVSMNSIIYSFFSFTNRQY